MAKRINSGTTKATGETKAAATKETKARRAPARRRTDNTKTDAPIALASDHAQPERIETAAVPATGADIPSPEDVSRRAYEIYCGRGCTHGSDVEDWLEAERQLRDRTH